MASPGAEKTASVGAPTVPTTETTPKEEEARLEAYRSRDNLPNSYALGIQFHTVQHV